MKKTPPGAADVEAGTPAESAVPSTAVVKRTFNLPLDSDNAVRKLAAARATTVTEVIKRAIWIEERLYEEIQNGGRIYVEMPDNTKKELLIMTR